MFSAIPEELTETRHAPFVQGAVLPNFRDECCVETLVRELQSPITTDNSAEKR
jgi:hypothetical protein